MKLKSIKTLVLSLALLLAITSLFAVPPTATASQGGPDGDTPPMSLAELATSATDPDDEHFVADIGGELDQYLYRSDGDGFIRFDIPITRYYFNEDDPSIHFDSNGFLTTAARQHVIDKQVLPRTVTLRLRAWDVDEDDLDCPEVDYIHVNGEQVGQLKLSGANSAWSTPSYQIPIEFVKFPKAKGTNGNPPQPANNEISIQIDALQCGASEGHTFWWAVQIDWGVIEIPSPVRPIIFAHGWTGNIDAFNQFEDWMMSDGIPSARQVNLQRGIYPITETALWLKNAIDKQTAEFGVDKLNVFAHSKGGLVTRRALDDNSVAKKVENVITFATPHHGTERASLAWLKCRADFGSEPVNEDLCNQAAQEFSIDRMRDGFNYTGCTKQWPWSAWQNCRTLFGKRQPNVSYYSFASQGDEAVVPLRSTTYPWNADVPFPNTINVDHIIDTNASFSNRHGAIISNQTAYNYAIDYLSAGMYSLLSAQSAQASDNQVEAQVSLLAENQYQNILSQAGTLNAGSTQTISSSLDSGTLAIFEVQSVQALTYTLIRPNGQPIDPTVAAADPNIAYSSGFDGTLWFFQYEISAPATGTWQNVLSAGTTTDFVVINLTNSILELSYKTDKSTYRPGDLVTLETALWNGSAAATGVSFTGVVTHPDASTSNLTFYDDGSHGDITPSNGIYTARFTTLPANGHAVISLGAIKDNITRIAETSIAVVSQTAQFQYVTSEYPEDTNGNSLYDNLNIGAYVYVYESGQFELQGTLVDGSGRPVATGYYSTLMAGTGPLSTGWHSLILTFDGNEIYQHGINGPYTLTNITIFDVSDYALEVDTVNEVYTTSAYQFDQFEHTTIALAGGSEAVYDVDSNGLYDWLQVSLNINVVAAGDYDVNGRLVSPDGTEIAWSLGQFYAPNSGVYTVDLWFDGYEIGGHKANGPFTVRDVSISNASGINDASFAQAYTTQAYSVLSFEGVFATFADASTSHWAWNYIERLYSAGITSGCGTNPLTYCPDVTVTRAQMAVFLLRGMYGSAYNPPPVGASTGFGDVPTDHWAAAWIKQLAAEGITAGCGNGNYCPEYPVTRDQMAVFLLRAEHGPGYNPPDIGTGTGFDDVPPQFWAAAWVKQLAIEGITAGCGSSSYCPSTPVSRAQMAVFLVRTFNLP